jgi:hypothetical protein
MPYEDIIGRQISTSQEESLIKSQISWHHYGIPASRTVIILISVL